MKGEFSVFASSDPIRQLQSDFFFFHHAMKKELERHFPKKGLSYRAKTYYVFKTEDDAALQLGGTAEGRDIGRVVSAVERFRRLIDEAFEVWQFIGRPSQLVDIANLCGMSWMHENGIFNKQNDEHTVESGNDERLPYE